MIPGTYVLCTRYVCTWYQPAEIYTYVRGGTHDTYVPPVDAHVWRQLHLSAVARCSDSCILYHGIIYNIYYILRSIYLSSLWLSSSTRRRFYPQRSSGQAVVTGVVPSPLCVPLNFIAHRVQHSHCSSIFIECCIPYDTMIVMMTMFSLTSSFSWNLAREHKTAYN